MEKCSSQEETRQEEERNEVSQTMSSLAEHKTTKMRLVELWRTGGEGRGTEEEKKWKMKEEEERHLRERESKF